MQTALITGITKGIGRALAEKFLAEGFFVIGTTRDGKTTLENPNLKVYTLELTSPESIQSCADEMKKDEHEIDIFINNAGTLEDEDETTVIISKLRKTLEVNLIGTIDFTEQVREQVREVGNFDFI